MGSHAYVDDGMAFTTPSLPPSEETIAFYSFYLGTLLSSI